MQETKSFQNSGRHGVDRTHGQVYSSLQFTLLQRGVEDPAPSLK